jgi:hypothetical protein
MNGARISLSIALLAVAVSARSSQPAIRADDLVGTWQLVSIKDLTTGKIDDVGTHQLLWLQLTKSHWTYLWMDLDRATIEPEQLDRLPPDRRVRENYTKIWDDEGRHRFWGAGGKYRLDGNRFVYTNDISIEPYMLTRTGVEIIAQLTSTTYVRHSINQKGEVVKESVFRKIG